MLTCFGDGDVCLIRCGPGAVGEQHSSTDCCMRTDARDDTGSLVDADAPDDGSVIEYRNLFDHADVLFHRCERVISARGAKVPEGEVHCSALDTGLGCDAHRVPSRTVIVAQAPYRFRTIP